MLRVLVLRARNVKLFINYLAYDHDRGDAISRTNSRGIQITTAFFILCKRK